MSQKNDFYLFFLAQASIWFRGTIQEPGSKTVKTGMRMHEQADDRVDSVSSY